MMINMVYVQVRLSTNTHEISQGNNLHKMEKSLDAQAWVIHKLATSTIRMAQQLVPEQFNITTIGQGQLEDLMLQFSIINAYETWKKKNYLFAFNLSFSQRSPL